MRPAGTRRAFVPCWILAACCACAREPPPVRAADSGASLDSLIAAAEAVYFNGEYDSASTLFRQIRERAQRETAVAAEARALTWLGLAAWRLGEYRTARQLGEEALALKLTHRLTDQLWRSYNALGLLAWNENRFSDATNLFDAAITMAGEAGDRRGAASAALNLALVHTELGNFSDARAGFITNRSLAGELGETRMEANALTNLGMLEIRLGNLQAAIPVLEDALRLYERIGYATGTQSALGQLGVAYAAIGEPGRAFSVLDSALRVARTQGLRQEEASNLEALAEVYRDAGDHHRAILLYRAAGEINADLGLDVETGEDLRGEADIYVRLGELGRARANAEQALVIHRRAEARLAELRDRLLLAEILDRQGNRAAVAAEFVAAGRLADLLGARIARVEVALAQARIADRHNDARGVLQATRAVLPELARGGYAAEAEAQLMRARAFGLLEKFDSAATAGRRALATVERVRQNFGSGALRTTFVAEQWRAYGELVSTLLQLGQVEEAFEVADRARGRALLEQLSNARPSRPSSSASALADGEALLRQIDKLAGSIDLLEEAPPADRGADQARELEQLHARLHTARSHYEALFIQAVETNAGEVSLLGASHVAASGVQAALRPGQLLVEYLVIPNGRVSVFAVRSTGVRVVEVPISADNLASRVRLARDLIARPGSPRAPTEGVLTGLHDVLIGPVSEAGALENVAEIIFVPHQVLNYLPFAALRNRSTERYLIEDYTIRLLPSAATLPALQARDGRDAALRGTSVLAPFPDRLPATRAEARAVTGGAAGTRVYLGASATEAALRTALQDPGMVHVATHGILNVWSPMFSRLELARGASDDPADDGRLEIHELLGINVQASIVFLSGCDTGVGAAHSTRFARGEDYATLAQAFLYGGARAVIATLWPVEDAGAAAFAERFYQELATSTPLQALAATQRSMLLRASYSAPYHWAAYQFAGDAAWGRTALPEHP